MADRGSVARVLLRAAGVLAITLVVAEIVLDVAALFVHDREDATAHVDTARHVVCVGDSHTYGALVPANASFPAQLQRLLDAEEPGRFDVVNLGVPGFNTALTRARLATALGRYHPDTVVVWCGVNDSWNRTAVPAQDGSLLARLDTFAVAHVRLYRLLRTRLHDRALDAALARSAGGRPDVVAREGGGERVAVTSDAGTEEIAYDRQAVRVDRALEDALVSAYRGMVDDARAAGARIVFLAYPSETDAFAPANRALRRVWAETGVPVVDTWQAVQRVPADQRQMLWAGHPNAAMYAEIARDVHATVVGASRDPQPTGSVLARLAGGDAPSGNDAAVHGPCPYGANSPYRWTPAGDPCFLEQGLAIGTPAARLTARVRIDTFPTGPSRWGGYNVLGVFEPFFGTGAYVQIVPPDRLRLFTLGDATGGCGPLRQTLAPGVWYGIEVSAEKGERGPVRLALTSDGGQLIEDIRCDDQPTGGGNFLRVRVGSADPGAVAAVDVANVAVRLDPDPPR